MTTTPLTASPIVACGAEEIRALAGTDLGASRWVEVTQDRIDTFAAATGDHQWIHVDVARAASGPFGRTIAHGYLTLSLVVPLFAELLELRGGTMTLNYGLNKVRFPAPVPAGGRIRLRGQVLAVTELTGGVELTIDFIVEAEGQTKPACVAQAVYRHIA
ncbi:MAG TPA: MaoC family dehydratase [Nocardioides sp.]|uniref:MaoC family dehydratase n=1 Tax=Nocardioides sp. TaxID=35761 RepID=UPI002D809120|nr:MaoC family dehydratase [Nocardioides sp.]HET6651097.1 MaoC family dehydratase [Nocardioides sp.]